MPFVLFLIGLLIGAGGLYGYVATGHTLPASKSMAGAQPRAKTTVYHGAALLRTLSMDNENNSSPYTIGTKSQLYRNYNPTFKANLDKCLDNTDFKPEVTADNNLKTYETTIKLNNGGNTSLVYVIVPVVEKDENDKPQFIFFQDPGDDEGNCTLSSVE